MKNHILSCLGLFSLIILLSLSSCTRESDVITTTTTDVVIEMDTSIVEGKVTLRSSDGSQQLQGIYINCEIESGQHLNALAYGIDLQIIGEESVFEDDLYIQYWITEGPLQPGTYLTEGTVISEDPVTTPLVFFEIIITEVNDLYLKGTFQSVNLENQADFETISGDFNTAIYSCSILEIEIEDFSQYTYGRATLTVNDETQIHMGASGFCRETFLGQEEEIGIIAIGGVMEIDENQELNWDNATGIFFTNELPNKEIEVLYNALYIVDFETLDEIADANGGVTYAEAAALGKLYQILYLEITETTVKGLIFYQEEKVGEFNTSRFVCG